MVFHIERCIAHLLTTVHVSSALRHSCSGYHAVLRNKVVGVVVVGEVVGVVVVDGEAGKVVR